MNLWMKNYKIPDDEVEKLFGIETTTDWIKQIALESASEDISTATDNGGAITGTTTETTLTENASMLQPTSSGKTSIGTGNSDGSAVSTTEADLSVVGLELQG